MPIPFDRYLNIRSAYTPTWLEGGKRVAFLTDITGTPQVWAVDTSGGWPDQLTFFTEKVWTLSASPDGKNLICTRDIGGNENYQIFLISANGEEVRRISRDREAIYHFGIWFRDSNQIAFTSNERNGVHFDVYFQSLSGEPQLVFQSDGNYRIQAVSPDGKHLMITNEISSAKQVLYLLEIETGNLQSLGGDKANALHLFIRWGSNGEVYLLTNRDRDFLNPARLDISTGEISYLGEYPWDIETLSVSPDGNEIAFSANIDGYKQLMLHQIKTGKIRKVKNLPQGVVAEPSFSPNSSQLAVSVQSPQNNLDIWVVDIDSLSTRQVTHSSMAGIPQDTLVTPELIRYKTFDGLEIPAFWYQPKNVSPPYPVILYVHGGPASQIIADFDPRFQFFLNRGYAILATNVRGSSGYGQTYMALDDIHLRMNSVADLKYAVKWLSSSETADPERIAIYGRSYGGFMVLSAITTYPELWAAAVDVVGIANWVTFLENTSPWRRAHREKEYGSLKDDHEFLESISPIHKADQIQSPLLVIHGANDPRVPVTEADQIVAHLKNRGHPVEYLRYEDEGHKISKLHNRIDSFNKMADFLDRCL